MRIMTAVIAALVCSITCLFPGLISGKLMLSILIGAGVSFLTAFLTYSYRDPINDAPTDVGSIILGNLVGAFFSAISVSAGYWQAFWLSGATVTLGLVLGALCVFLIARMFTSSMQEAVEFAESFFKKK